MGETGDTGDRKAGVRKLDELQGIRVSSRATGDLTCGLRVCVCVCRESRREAPVVVVRATWRVIIVYSSLLRHAFAAPESCLCRVTMATHRDGSGAYTQKYQLVSFRDGDRR